jgi:hypothetical protein
VKSPVPSPDSFNIDIAEEYVATAGTVVARLSPSGSDEILIHDVSDTAQTKPKKIALSEIMSVSDEAEFNQISVSTIAAKTSSGITVVTDDSIIVNGATYASLNGFAVTVTKANHGLNTTDVVQVDCTSTQGGAGINYSGVFRVESVTANSFVYYLTNEQFLTLNENTEGEVDVPVSSEGTATYKKVGTIDVDGNVVVRNDVFIDGTTYHRGDTLTWGRAKFGELVLPKGRTSSRPTTPEEGQLFYNRDDDIVEIFRKSVGFPSGSWETFDKVSNQIVIPFTYSTATLIADTANTWYSKTIWTLDTPVRYKQYEITLPPVRLQHYNHDNDFSSFGKLELIAVPETPTGSEHVIARFVSHRPNHCPWDGEPIGGKHRFIYSIPGYNRIITPDDIDMSTMKLVLRVSCWQQQNVVADDSEYILPSIGYVRITPLVRKGAGTVPIPTPWTSEIQNLDGSKTNITTAQRLPIAWWMRYNGINSNYGTEDNMNDPVVGHNVAYPGGPAPIPVKQLATESASNLIISPA